MIQHLRANLWLLLLTVLICCVLYPLVLWGIGQTVFRDKANGSLVFDKDGAAIGSRLIAQPFTADEYFHSRPSAVGYNGAASGASNWGANNPALRKRVEGMLGSVLKYRDGRPVGPDIATWVQAELQKDPAILSKWAADDGSLAEHWAAADSANGEFLTKWQAEHAEAVARLAQGEPRRRDRAQGCSRSFLPELRQRRDEDLARNQRPGPPGRILQFVVEGAPKC